MRAGDAVGLVAAIILLAYLFRVLLRAGRGL